MNHNSIVPTTPIQGQVAGDPYAELALHIIRRAAWDYRNVKYRPSVSRFFASDLYRLYFDYITLCVPSFDPQEYILPCIVSESESFVDR